MGSQSDQFGLSSNLPSGVEVRFPGKLCQVVASPQPAPTWYIKTYQISDFSSEPWNNIDGHPGKFIIHDHCYAIYDGTSSNPVNKTILDALAKQLAIDFYNWRTFRFNLVINGVINPQLDASIDIFEIVYLQDECFSRLQTGPFNGEPEEFFHIDKDCDKSDVVYVPVASRRGNFLHLPKAHVKIDDCGNVSLQTSSYDEVFICCHSTSSSSASSSGSDECPTFACKVGCGLLPVSCTMVVIVNGLHDGDESKGFCSGVDCTFFVKHTHGCTWFASVGVQNDTGITVPTTCTLDFGGGSFSVEVIDFDGNTATFTSTGFDCQHETFFTLQSTSCSEFASASCEVIP